MKELMRSLTVTVGPALGIVAGFTLSAPSRGMADEMTPPETDMMPAVGGICHRCVNYLEPDDLYQAGQVCMAFVSGYTGCLETYDVIRRRHVCVPYGICAPTDA